MGELKKDINAMVPVGKLGYIDIRMVVTSVGKTVGDAEKASVIGLKQMVSLKDSVWEVVEQVNELVTQVTLGEYQGPGWVVTAVFVVRRKTK